MESEDSQEQKDKEKHDLGGAISLRSMLLRHQLAQEIRVMRCENFGSAYFLTASKDNLTEFENSLNRLLRYTPTQPVGNPPLLRNEPSKDQVILRKRNSVKHRYSVPFFYTAFKIVTNFWVHHFITLLLLINICTSVYLASYEEEDHPFVFQILRNFEFAATGVYCFEVLLQMIAYGIRYFYDNNFITPYAVDLVILILSMIPPGFILLIVSYQNKDITKVNEQIKFVYILNALRVFRIVTRTNSLLHIAQALLKSYKQFAFVTILIFIIMYIFAILAMNLFYSFTTSKRDDLEFKTRFSSFGSALITVFQIMTFESWLAMCQEISSVCNPIITYVYFIAWVWLGAFVISNIFVGVLVDQFKSETDCQKERKDNEKVAKFAIRERKKHAKMTGSARRFNAKMQLTGREIAQKIAQIYSQFEAFETTNKEMGVDENCKAEIVNLLKKMGQDYETIWKNKQLYQYFKILCQISDNIAEMEQLEKIASQAIHACIETKS